MSVLYYCIHKPEIPFIAITKILYWFEMVGNLLFSFIEMENFNVL